MSVAAILYEEINHLKIETITYLFLNLRVCTLQENVEGVSVI
jgi:hypothetical protein